MTAVILLAVLGNPMVNLIKICPSPFLKSGSGETELFKLHGGNIITEFNDLKM